MINEEKTFNEFGYLTSTLSYGSNKRVWVICDICSTERIISYRQSVKIGTVCRSCSPRKPVTDETKRKMSNSHIGNKHSNETINKMRLSNTGKRRTLQQRRRISESHADVSGSKNPMFGVLHTSETKRKMSEKAKMRTGDKNSYYGKTHSDISR